MTQNDVSYTAVVLEREDRHRLLARLSPILVELHPAGFSTRRADGDFFCHHMTCNMGRCPEASRPHLGADVILTVTDWGLSERALALRVSGGWDLPVTCLNAVPHITVAVNSGAGGKPMHSNAITLWFPLGEPIAVLGKFREVRA